MPIPLLEGPQSSDPWRLLIRYAQNVAAESLPACADILAAVQCVRYPPAVEWYTTPNQQIADLGMVPATPLQDTDRAMPN